MKRLSIIFGLVMAIQTASAIDVTTEEGQIVLDSAISTCIEGALETAPVDVSFEVIEAVCECASVKILAKMTDKELDNLITTHPKHSVIRKATILANKYTLECANAYFEKQ